jgi:hypothetical protein
MSRLVDFDDGFTTANPPTDSDIATQAELDAHVNDTSAAHAASAIGFTPGGTIASTDAQGAISEVATDAASALASHEADTTAIHGIADTSALSVKTATETLSGKTFSDPVTLTEVATPAAPSATHRKVYTKSDGKLYHMGSDGIEKAVGSGAGGGGINLLTLGSTYSIDNQDDSDVESTLGRWAVYADAAGTSPVDMTGGSPGSTVARTTSSPLNGAASILFDLGSGSSRQGEGVVLGPVYVPPGYRGRDLEFTAVWSATGALVEDDLKQYAYDVTNSALLDVVRTSKIIGSAGKWRGVVSVPSTCAQLRIGVHVARTSTAALSIKFDDVKLSDSQTYTGLAGSNTRSDLTWTYDNVGTVSANNVYYSRVGDRIRVSGNFTPGTVAVAVFAINLPSGLLLDSTKLTSNQEIGQIQTLAGNIPTTTAGPYALFYDGSSTSKVFMAITGGSGTFSKANGSNVGTGTVSSFWFEAPIAGWDANVTLGASSTFKISSYLANGTRVTGSAPTQLGQYRSYLRTGGTLTWTETNGDPTTLPNASDGLKLTSVTLQSSSDTAHAPSKYDIFVGKNKNVRIDAFASPGRTGFIDTSVFVVGSTYNFGVMKFYDPATGIVTLQVAAAGQPNIYVGQDIGTNGLSTVYFDITVSENALAVGIQAPRSEVQAKGSPAAGFGSTNTRIRRFNSAQVNTGTAITYADSATLGGSFTINEDGVYAISYYDYTPAGTAQMGISKNTTGPTTAVFSLTDTEIVCAVTVTSAFRGYCGNTLNLKQGDVIRAHTDGTQGNSQDGTQTRFTITKGIQLMRDLPFMLACLILAAVLLWWKT